MKISFANAVADVCEAAGADILQVVKGVGLDKRIGRAFLNAGIGFGGSCFPKDLRAFVQDRGKERLRFRPAEGGGATERGAARTGGGEAEARSVDPDGKEDRAPGAGLQTQHRRHPGSPGAGHRPTADRGGGFRARLRPAGGGQGKRAVPLLAICPDPYAVAEQAEAVVLCTEWPEFAALDFGRLKASMVRPLILDGRNVLDREKLTALGFEYIGIGRGQGGRREKT